MYQRTRSLVLHWLKVPPEPQAPAGAPASLRVFRAGRNYLKLRLLGWAVPQLIALAGIVFWTVVLLDVEQTVREQRSAYTPATPATRSALAGRPGRQKERIRSWADFHRLLVNIGLLIPAWAFPLLWIFKIGGVLLYLAQIPLTYAVRRLDFELRWYVVTDRSLRIRTGVWQVQELTMSFANLQQVVVSQGPLQRVLGLADVHVQSAGGGSGASATQAHGAGDSLHTAVFHSVENATEIRDLILERLRIFRATGLGDPDDRPAAPGSPGPAATTPAVACPATSFETLAAARELLTEARALRRTLGT